MLHPIPLPYLYSKISVSFTFLKRKSVDPSRAYTPWLHIGVTWTILKIESLTRYYPTHQTNNHLLIIYSRSLSYKKLWPSLCIPIVSSTSLPNQSSHLIVIASLIPLSWLEHKLTRLWMASGFTQYFTSSIQPCPWHFEANKYYIEWRGEHKHLRLWILTVFTLTIQLFFVSGRPFGGIGSQHGLESSFSLQVTLRQLCFRPRSMIFRPNLCIGLTSLVTGCLICYVPNLQLSLCPILPVITASNLHQRIWRSVFQAHLVKPLFQILLWWIWGGL